MSKGTGLLILIIMILASLAVIVPITVFENVIMVFFTYYLVMCLFVPLVYLFITKKFSLKEVVLFLGFNNYKMKTSILIGLIHGLVFFFIIIGGFFLFRDAFMASDIISSLSKWGTTKKDTWLIFFIMVIFNGIVEEFFWRGYTYGKLKDIFSKWVTILLVTLFYTSYHFATVFTFFEVSYISIQIVISIFSVGVIWGWMRYKYKNILASTIGHTFATIGYMTIYIIINLTDLAFQAGGQ